MDIEDCQAKHLNFYEVISSQIFLILKASKATVHHKECYTLPGILEIWHNFFDISRIKSSNNLKTDDTTEILSNYISNVFRIYFSDENPLKLIELAFYTDKLYEFHTNIYEYVLFTLDK